MMIMGMPRPTQTQEQNVHSAQTQSQVQNPMIIGQPKMIDPTQIQMPNPQNQMQMPKVQPIVMNPQFVIPNIQNETNSIIVFPFFVNNLL